MGGQKALQFTIVGAQEMTLQTGLSEIKDTLTRYCENSGLLAGPHKEEIARYLWQRIYVNSGDYDTGPGALEEYLSRFRLGFWIGAEKLGAIGFYSDQDQDDLWWIDAAADRFYMRPRTAIGIVMAAGLLGAKQVVTDTTKAPEMGRLLERLSFQELQPGIWGISLDNFS